MKSIKYLVITFAIFFNSCSNNSSSNSYSTLENGDLNNTFEEKQELTPEQKFQQEKQQLISEGWEEKGMENGLMPSCYNFKPKSDKSIDNKLEINVGGGTDVVVKLMNVKSEKCIRYVFINSGSSYQIRNIPQGVYYLKIAYGKEWLSKIENNQCVGKFMRNPLYEKGEDIMDFTIQKTYDGYSIPSFRLSLDVISSNLSNSFSSHNISETDFNN
jgi:hypothetical protein